MTDAIMIDVETLPPAQRHREILQAFDALAPGAALVVLSPHRPAPLLRQFQAERPTLFDWNLLEDGPVRFRSEVVRRFVQGQRRVTEYLEGDHRRLDAIAGDAMRLAQAGSLADAGRRFAEFVCGLNHHILAEEEVLFPAFEEATGMSGGGPTEVMRSEHVAIRRQMTDATSSLSRGDAAEFLTAFEGLGRILKTHNMKEERILYPMADESAGSDGAREKLVSMMQAV